MFVKLDRRIAASCSRTAITSAPSSSWSRAARGPRRVRSALQGTAELPDADTAWISQAALRRGPRWLPDTAWQQSFGAMIEKARPHGWIDDARKAIKAHVEWVG